jgi:hypothetical protein
MSSIDRDVPSSEIDQVSQDTVLDERRREAMRRMAKYAAPAMLALLIAEKAVAQSLPPP